MRRWRFAHRAGACCHQELCCKSQDSAGEIGTATWVGMGSENTDVWHRNNSENYANSARGILGFTSSHRSIASDVFPTFHADIPDGEQPQGKSLQMRHLSSTSYKYERECCSGIGTVEVKALRYARFDNTLSSVVQRKGSLFEEKRKDVYNMVHHWSVAWHWPRADRTNARSWGSPRSDTPPS
jgi:hypothetical protein